MKKKSNKLLQKELSKDVEEYYTLHSQIQKLEKRKKELNTKIKGVLPSNADMEINGFTVKVYSSDRYTIDAQKLVELGVAEKIIDLSKKHSKVQQLIIRKI